MGYIVSIIRQKNTTIIGSRVSENRVELHTEIVLDANYILR